MPISFQCRNCGREVTAPDSAAGKRGRCPFCEHPNDIPARGDNGDLIPLAPVDEEDERKTKEEIRSLLEQERELLVETSGPPAIPLSQRENISSEDLHHFVVNYCLDMAAGKLHRAGMYVEQLREYGPTGVQAVEDFISGGAIELALDPIPRPVLQEFLKQLKGDVR